MPAFSIISQETIDKANSYLSACKDQFTKRKKKVSLPKMEGLCLAIGISRDTAYEWIKKAEREQETELIDEDLQYYKMFADIVERMQQMQAERLIDNGLSGNYNPSIAKLILGKHGYRDEINQKSTSVDVTIKWDTVDKQQALRIRNGEDPFVVLRPEQYQ